MKLVVGLGNPGKKYAKTRHNVGFLLLDEWAAAKKLNWSVDKKSQAQIIKTPEILLARPLTFMNRSGSSVGHLMDYYNFALEDLLVVHDDVDLKFGQTRLQKGAGSAGHRGVQDIIVRLHSKEFWRFRVGVGRPKLPMSTEDWVLSDFAPSELAEVINISLPISGS